ncbi:hypothetical protein [Borreliella valaisiana]|uniref:hypothetical protein n=1 Tax=Borreliella valaisiana TaxID=62088 RepID=UPI003B22266C
MNQNLTKVNILVLTFRIAKKVFIVNVLVLKNFLTQAIDYEFFATRLNNKSNIEINFNNVRIMGILIKKVRPIKQFLLVIKNDSSC